MQNYLEFVARFAKSILVLLGLITFYFIWQIGYLTEDSNPYLLPETHPARKSLLDMRKDFTGTHDAVIVTLYNDATIYNKDSLNAIFELTRQSLNFMFADESDRARLALIKKKYARNKTLVTGIDQILADGFAPSDGAAARKLYQQIDAACLSAADYKYLRVFAERVDPIREMAGLAATEDVRLDADGALSVAIPVDGLDLDPQPIRNATLGNELMEMGMVDKTGKVALIAIEVSILQDDAQGQLRAYEAFEKLIANYQAQHPQFTDEIFIGGTPVFFAEMKKVMDHDLGILLPGVILLVGLVLLFFFRTTLGVVIPLVNVVMCTIWTLGMMALTGVPLDLITSMLPVFLITICSSDAIHVMAEYYRRRRLTPDNREALALTMKSMSSPVILTTLTTCLTFTVSTATSIANLRHFGIFISFGMFVAMLISLLLIPAWLALLAKSPKIKRAAPQKAEDYIISRFLTNLFKPVIKYRPAFIAGFAILIIVAGWLASRVYTDDMGSGYFARDNTFRKADDFINSHIAGTSPGWIEIDTHQKDGALKLEVVSFVDQLEKFLHQQNNVTYSYSIARYVRRINYVLNAHDAKYNRLPMAREKFRAVNQNTGDVYEHQITGDDFVRQAVLRYENGGGSDLTNVLNPDFSKTVLLYTMNTTVASDYQALLDVLEPWLKENTPAGLDYKLAGPPVIWTAVLDELLAAQRLSLGLAFGTVILVMSLWLRSIRMALAGTLPLAVTVLCYFAVMTVLDIELNIGTAIISFLVLGIVDYSVHYLLRIEEGLQGGLKLDDALMSALTKSGRSIVANVFVFSIGFIALLFSSFKPIVDLGTLVGFSLFISGVMSLFVITLLAPWLIPNRELSAS